MNLLLMLIFLSALHADGKRHSIDFDFVTFMTTPSRPVIVSILLLIKWNLYIASRDATVKWCRNGENALNQLRDVEQISLQFVSEYSLWNACIYGSRKT